MESTRLINSSYKFGSSSPQSFHLLCLISHGLFLYKRITTNFNISILHVFAITDRPIRVRF